MDTVKIPVIDFKSFGLGASDLPDVNSASVKSAGAEIVAAFRKFGFCYLTHHGVEQELLDEYKEVSRNFFEQPIEVKQKYTRADDINFGWVSVGRESLNPERPGDLKEAFNYYPPDDPGCWPTCPEFQTVSQKIFQKFTDLTHRVGDVLSVGLGLGSDLMRESHKYIGQKGNMTTIRTLFYPPLLDDSAIKPGQIRLGEHSDYGSITLLFQDDMGGLEVNVPGHGWVPATPIPGTVLVNTGDLMQRWTADDLLGTKHRVLIPEEELRRKICRQSVVFFVHPDDKYIIKCLDGSNKYDPVSSIDYLNSRFSVTY